MTSSVLSRTAPFDLRWLRQIARDRKAVGLPLAVATIMTERLDGRTRQTFVSQATIAGALGVTVEGVRKASQRLIAGGHLELVSAGRGGRPNGGGRSSNLSNVYRAIVAEIPQPQFGEIDQQSPNDGSGISDKSPNDSRKIPQQRSENPPTSVPPIPLYDPSKDPIGKRRAKTSLPGGVPSEKDLAWAEERCALKGQSLDLPDQAERFRDYHTANGTTSADWSASWRTWIGNALGWSAQKAAGSSLRSVMGYSALDQQMTVLNGGGE